MAVFGHFIDVSGTLHDHCAAAVVINCFGSLVMYLKSACPHILKV